MPATYGLLAAILAMTAINTALSLSDPHAGLAVADTARHAMSAGRDFAFLFVALGAVGAAGEFRHGTAIPTFLATPVRRRVVSAKIATYLALGMLVAQVAALLQLAIVLPWTAANGHALEPWSADVLEPLAGGIVAGACYAALGVCVGLLVRNQLVALVVALGWFTVAENALAILTPGISRFLPGGAFSGVDTDGLQLLPLYTAVPLLAAWVIAISAVALRTTLRRDVA
jgi:ABC-type transport system involved in multi-copper enzyme maturation permease subunit